MNKIIAIIALIVIVGAAGFILFSNNSKPVDTNTEIKSEETPITAMVTVVNSDVQTQAPLESEFQTVDKTAEVKEGSKVKTSLSGRAIVESENATVSVDKNAEITIQTQVKNKNKIHLAVGNLWAKVKNVFGQGEYFQVETPNAVATVRGTAFSVLYSIGKTVIWVHEGEVAVISIDPLTKQQIGNEVIVKAGQKASTTDGDEPVLQDVSAQDKRTEWYLFNNQETRNNNQTPKEPEPVFCTQDAKLCPDGSYVGRVAPKCEFKACPEAAPVQPNQGGDPYKR